MNRVKETIVFLTVTAVFLVSGSVLGYSQETAGRVFEKALYFEESEGDLQQAIGLYQKVVAQFSQDREVAAKAQLHIGLCYEKLGLNEAEKAFQQVLVNYPEQTETVHSARLKLSRLLQIQADLENEPSGPRMRQISGVINGFMVLHHPMGGIFRLWIGLTVILLYLIPGPKNRDR